MRTLLVIACLVLLPCASIWLAAVALSSFAPASSPPPAPDTTHPLELNTSNYKAVAAALASTRREIILTTVDISFHGKANLAHVLAHFKNFAYHLSSIQRLRNLLTVSYSPQTCAILAQQAGIPCFVDHIAPQDLPGAHKYQPPTFQKYWHALELTRLNYTLLVVDTDMSIVQDPFHFHNASFDIEGLSDWHWLNDTPGRQALLDQGCPIYKMVHRSRKSRGAIEGHWKLKPWNHHQAAKHLSPCQSTGLWFSEPRDATVEFLEHMLDWMLNQHPEQWEQAAWNEVIMAHLIVVGEGSQLRYRLLPMQHFCNVESLRLRTRAGLPMDAVIVHAGGVHGANKTIQLNMTGYWAADKWQPSMGEAAMERLMLLSRSN